MAATDPSWQKPLFILGGGLATVGLCWYLFREAPLEDEASCGAPVRHFKVIDGYKNGIAIRTDASIDARRTHHVLSNGEVFGVSEVVTPARRSGIGYDPQQYLRLADGRGWAFTHSIAGHEIAEEISWDEAVRTTS
eukprot:TRINITY_DN67312_c0_g1_i1.p1 TRINITY_DN67312_c0_g1~~TRINITY_DN67312_c0_g1_i1.p1  ORF type:complete len:136 (-),score=18.98 TRINITY_DN67312_c0_g1_i1:218-625(-)